MQDKITVNPRHQFQYSNKVSGQNLLPVTLQHLKESLQTLLPIFGEFNPLSASVALI